jgi:chemotaxis protein MotB
MVQTLTRLSMLLFVIALCSCAAKKELAAVNVEKQNLQTAYDQQVAKNAELQSQVNKLTEANKTANAEFSSFRTECENTKKELAELEAMITEVVNSMMEVEKKLETEMQKIESQGVDVNYKDGLVYVSLPESLMYKSGSAVLGDKSKAALESLATVLNQYPNLKVYVIGNTDDKQAKKGADNWSLSTERANGVVRILRDKYQVDPARLVAAGKGKYDPVADNTTDEGRAKNRRTEIILNPEVSKLLARAMQ